MAWHFDSRPMTEVPENEDDDGRAFGDLLSNLLKVNQDHNNDNDSIRHLAGRFYDLCHFEKDYEPSYFLRH